MSDTIDSDLPLLLSRAKVCQMLSITEREFYALVSAGKLHPLQTRHRHLRIPLAEVMNLKAEYAHRALAMPYEKFIQAASFFTENALEINGHLVDLGYPKAPVDYIERCRLAAKDSKLSIIKEKTIGDFFRVFGAAQDLLRRGDFRLLVECLTMIRKSEKEIREIIKAKYGRDYGEADILRFIEYFYNWNLMDPQSVNFYMDFVQGRERVIKTCAIGRADYFIYWALGLDFGGEIPELLEKSTLGLMHKFNVMIDGYVYGTTAVTQRDLKGLAEIILDVLGAAQTCRAGKVPKGKQGGVVDNVVPAAMNRDKFFATERSANFGEGPKAN